MIHHIRSIPLFLITGLMAAGCQSSSNHDASGNETAAIKLITLDPAHFHSALVQKTMYPGIDSEVEVYAPKGLGLTEQLDYIKQYNNRAQNPTHWIEHVYTGNDYLQKMVSDKRGNVVVMAGNNQRKTEYIKKSIDAGFNVLADKPMAINKSNFDTLLQAFADAKERGLILYDIMTERSVVATIIQRKLARSPSVFGTLEQGTTGTPAITMESEHRYFKQVSGRDLIRPDWFFDPSQEGDALTDVGTHLVDLVQWVCFPDVSLNYSKDIHIQSAKIWPTPLSLSQFTVITKEDHFPDFLKKYVKNDSMLLTHGNGEADYTIKGIHVNITVKWTYQGPDGAGDTYNSLLRGTRANLELRQGKNESWQPTLYVWPTQEVKDTQGYIHDLHNVLNEINVQYPGIGVTKYHNGWKILIPEKYRLGHEAHFGQVMERYLKYLKDGKLPDWEIPDMIAKYYTTSKALEMAQSKSE